MKPTKHIVILTVLSLFCNPAWTAPPKKLKELPSKPVTVDELAPEELAAFRAPLKATVKSQALTGEIPIMSFTSGTGRKHLNLHNDHGGFEPMAFRPLLRAHADDPDRVILYESDTSGLPSGFYDGARIRVYHPIDGKLVKIRDAVLPPGSHQATGWYNSRGMLSTKADKSDVRIKVDDRFLLNRDYWFTVVAVDKFGQRSEPATPVKLHLNAHSDRKTKEDGPIGWLRFNGDAPDKPTPPATPTDFKVNLQDHVLVCSWAPVSGKQIMGYKILISPYDPATHQGFFFKLPTREPRPDQVIQQNDLVFVDQFKHTITPDQVAPYAIWANKRPGNPFKSRHIENKTGEWWGDGSDFPVKWAFVKHPQPLPKNFNAAGETCLRWENTGDDFTGFSIYAHAEKSGGWYPVLDPVEHTVEAWVRGSGEAKIAFIGPYAAKGVDLPFNQRYGGDGSMDIPPVDLPLSDEWRLVKATFTPPKYVEKGIGFIYVTLKGKGVLYVDNLRIYASDHPYGEYHPITLKRINESHMRFMRTHELIKTKWGYTLEGMTNPTGANNYSGNRMRKFTFFGLLQQIKKAGNIAPWLQIEMCLNEEEWLGFVEWLCAPYDPAKDSPQTKPWAAKRYAMGQRQPWIEEWDEFGFEISNETWNRSFAPYDMGWGMTIRDGATGEEHSWGACYGLLNEYVIEVMRSSPHWSAEVEKKMKYMLCGWTAAQNYGADAKRYSPSADVITYASYQHNDWGLGDPKKVNDFKRFYWLQWGQSAIKGQTAKSTETERLLAAEGIDVESGVYEFGPAYHVMPGDPKEAKEIDVHLARGMVAAVYCLDATLLRCAAGFSDQAFFTFGHQTGTWGSHTTIPFGAHPYPYWKAFQLYNQFGTGRFLEIDVTGAPSWDFPAYDTEDNMHKVRRDELPDAPLISVYASVKNQRVTLFLLSRKIDNFPITGDNGYTPAEIALPFKKAGKITLYKLVGDPRTEDRFKEHTKVETVDIPTSAFKGTLRIDTDARGIPPASILVYVFEQTDIGQVNNPPKVRFAPAGPVIAGETVLFENRSSDLDGDPLSYTWSSGTSNTSDKNATLTFTTAAMTPVKLKVEDGHGGAAEMQRDVPVSIRFGGLLWTPLPTIGHQSQGARAVKQGDALMLTGDGKVPGGTYALLAGQGKYKSDFSFEAVVQAVEAKNAQTPTGGLVLVAPNKRGLGFSHDSLKNLATHIGVLVAPDGAVSLVRHGHVKKVKANTALPLKMKLEHKAGTVVAAIETGGTWEEIGRIDDLGSTMMIPALTAGSGKARNDVTVKLTGVRISE